MASLISMLVQLFSSVISSGCLITFYDYDKPLWQRPLLEGRVPLGLWFQKQEYITIIQGSLAMGRHGNCAGKRRAHVIKQKQETESILGSTGGHPSLCSTSHQASVIPLCPSAPALLQHYISWLLFFSSDWNFCISFCLACSFALLNGTKVINNHVAEPILNCLEIS